MCSSYKAVAQLDATRQLILNCLNSEVQFSVSNSEADISG